MFPRILPQSAPQVQVSAGQQAAARSAAPSLSYTRFEDSLKPVGHQAFLLDAKIMAAVLYHFLTDSDFRSAVEEEHRILAGLFDQYLERLREAYAGEVGTAGIR